MGGTDRCGILFYAGSTTTDIGLLLVAPAPRCSVNVFLFFVIIVRAKRANEVGERSEWNGRKLWQKKNSPVRIGLLWGMLSVYYACLSIFYFLKMHTTTLGGI
jgi:hypothetical protein